MKKILLFVAFVILVGGSFGLLAQPAPGDGEDPPDGPGIVDENGRASILPFSKTSTRTLRLGCNRPASQ